MVTCRKCIAMRTAGRKCMPQCACTRARAHARAACLRAFLTALRPLCARRAPAKEGWQARCGRRWRRSGGGGGGESRRSRRRRCARCPRACLLESSVRHTPCCDPVLDYLGLAAPAPASAAAPAAPEAAKPPPKCASSESAAPAAPKKPAVSACVETVHGRSAQTAST